MAARGGVVYARYERVGYDRFRLHEVRFAHPKAAVQVRRLESQLFWGWLADRWFRTRPEAVVGQPWRVKAEGCELTIQPRAPRPGSLRPGLDSTTEVLDAVAEVMPRARAWLASARVEEAAVAWPGDRLTVSGMIWSEGLLELHLQRTNLPPAAVRIDFTPGAPAWTLRASRSR